MLRAGIILGLTLSAACGLGDTLTLRDGRVVEGSFAGGDARQVRMAVAGRVETFDVGTVAKLEFSAPPPAASGGTLNGLAALAAIVAAAPNVEKAPEFVPNPFLTLPVSSQLKRQ